LSAGHLAAEEQGVLRVVTGSPPSPHHESLRRR
jgi:hypothetical protein